MIWFLLTFLQFFNIILQRLNLRFILILLIKHLLSFFRVLLCKSEIPSVFIPLNFYVVFHIRLWITFYAYDYLRTVSKLNQIDIVQRVWYSEAIDFSWLIWCHFLFFYFYLQNIRVFEIYRAFLVFPLWPTQNAVIGLEFLLIISVQIVQIWLHWRLVHNVRVFESNPDFL